MVKVLAQLVVGVGESMIKTLEINEPQYFGDTHTESKSGFVKRSLYRLGDSKCVDNGRPCGRVAQHAELLALTLLTTNNQECHSNVVGSLRDLMS